MRMMRQLYQARYLLILREGEGGGGRGKLPAQTMYRDMFSWTYSNIPDVESTIAMHPLIIEPNKHPVKHALRCLHQLGCQS